VRQVTALGNPRASNGTGEGAVANAPGIVAIGTLGKEIKAPSQDEVKHGGPATRESYH
jgi:hypothetical protein